MTSTLRGHHLLIYEPRTEGHHLVWLRFISEDLLATDCRLTLALDDRPDALDRIRNRLGPLLEKVTVISVWDKSGGRLGGKEIMNVAACLDRAQADRVFLNSFDEIASSLLRNAAIGRMPPPGLRGKISGIYLRPRFLLKRGISPNAWLKSAGFSRLMNGGWISHLLFLDPWIQEVCAARFPRTPVYFLPDPCPDDFAGDHAKARAHFEITEGRKVLLFYGAAYRRKGLHLAVEAMLRLPKDSPAFLLCAGQQMNDPLIQDGLKTLVEQGRAKVISRYIYEEEERILFAACNIVLLPYIKHFGNSAVLSRAGGAGKMVIASDEELVGKLVRQHNLGLLFPSGDVTALGQSIHQAVSAPPVEMEQWRTAAFRYAQLSSRAEFRRILLQSHGLTGNSPATPSWTSL